MIFGITIISCLKAALPAAEGDDDDEEDDTDAAATNDESRVDTIIFIK